MSTFFFFNQKTAYEMRISDWISDVCSSDLSTLKRSIAVMMASRGLSCVRSSYASGTNLHVVGEGASTTRQWQAAATVQICSNGGGRRRRRIAIRQAARSRLRWCARAAGCVGRFPSQVKHRSEEHTSELQ